MALRLKLLANGAQAISSHNTGYLRIWQLVPQDTLTQYGKPISMPTSGTIDNTLNADGNVIAISHDGKSLAAPGGTDGAMSILLWDLSTGQIKQQYGSHEGIITSLKFSPDDQLFVSAAWDHSIVLWDANTGKEIRRFRGHEGPVFDVSFSPDGRYLLSGSEDRTIILWDVATGTVVHHFEGFTDAVNTVSFSPDGKTALAGLGTIRSVAGSNEDNSLRLFDVTSFSEIRRFEGNSSPVTTVLFSSDGRQLVSGSTDATVRLWDAADGKEIRQFSDQSTAIWSLAYSSDQKYISAGSQDGTIMIWNSTTGDLLREYHSAKAMIYGVAFNSAQDTLLSADAGGLFHIWRLSLNLQSLMDWTKDNRYIRPLSCSEQQLYRLSNSCNE